MWAKRAEVSLAILLGDVGTSGLYPLKYYRPDLGPRASCRVGVCG
jgi:hypothetical protein